MALGSCSVASGTLVEQLPPQQQPHHQQQLSSSMLTKATKVYDLQWFLDNSLHL